MRKISNQKRMGGNKMNVYESWVWQRIQQEEEQKEFERKKRQLQKEYKEERENETY